MTTDCIESELELTSRAERLHCKVAQPHTSPWARLLIIHGYGEHAGRYGHFMRYLAARGVRCEAVDLRGHGRSTGRRGYIVRWEDYLEDIAAFFDAGRHRDESWASAPLFVLGHSHGGLIAAACGQRKIFAERGVVGCILCAPYLGSLLRPPLAKRLLARAAHHVVPWLRVKSGLRREWLGADPEMTAETRVDPLMNRIATPRWFFTVQRTQRKVLADAAQFTTPVLCLTGAADIIADPTRVAEFYENAGSADRSLYVYPDRLHELLRDVERQTVFTDVFAWIRARVEPRPQDALTSPAAG